MLPIRDTIQSRTYPVVNNLIIAANVLVFFIQMSQGPDSRLFTATYALIPGRYTDPELGAHFTSFQQMFSFISFMFLHGGFWHLLSNMWMLYIFGDNVEDHLGHLRYLVFYIACGLASAGAHMATNLNSYVPTVGTSGAIAGVMGAYMLLYPKSRVLTLIPIIIIPWFVEIPAFFFLGLWFVMQFLNAAGGGGDGIAWWAHVGGFIAGMALVRYNSRVPRLGADSMVRQYTERKTAPRLQVIRPRAVEGDPDLYGAITVTPAEAAAGARKLVNMPWGFEKRLVTVIVPPGVTDGTKLRLRGLGRLLPDGEKGDLYLYVNTGSRVHQA